MESVSSCHIDRSNKWLIMLTKMLVLLHRTSIAIVAMDFLFKGRIRGVLVSKHRRTKMRHQQLILRLHLSPKVLHSLQF